MFCRPTLIGIRTDMSSWSALATDGSGLYFVVLAIENGYNEGTSIELDTNPVIFKFGFTNCSENFCFAF